MEKYKLKIMTLDETDYINNLLDDCQKTDVHVYPDYLQLFQDYSGDKAIYIYFGNEQNFILIPYFERCIKSSKLGYVDLISPWYYGGLVHNVGEIKLLQEIFFNFSQKFDEYCKRNNIITEFQRFNPLLQNHMLYQNHSSLFYDRKIVYVDLSKDLETIKSEYTRHTRKNINKAIRNRLEVYHNDAKDSISKFIEIYTDSMRRKNAKKYYFFNKFFFNELFKKFKGNIKLFHVEFEGKVICSSIELGNKYILHDYLRGLNNEYLGLRPNDILIDEIIKWAKSVGYKYFVLGGGTSSSDSDGLLRFKESFSSTVSEFYVYKKIHNLEKYKKMCELSGKRQEKLEYENAPFFPEYVEQLRKR